MGWGLFMDVEQNFMLISTFVMVMGNKQNYTKHRAQYSTQLLKHHLGEVLWLPLGFMVTFLWSCGLKVESTRPPSWKLPQIKTAKHAISRVCSIILH
jgi:hypothetical protein